MHIILIIATILLVTLTIAGHVIWLSTPNNVNTIYSRRQYVMQHNNSHPSFMSRLWFMFLFEIATIWDDDIFYKSDILQIHDLYARMTFLGKLLFVCDLFSIIDNRGYGIRDNININGYWYIIKPLIMLPVFALYFMRMVFRLISHTIGGNSGDSNSAFIKPEPITEDKKSLHDIYDKS